MPIERQLVRSPFYAGKLRLSEHFDRHMPYVSAEIEFGRLG